LSYLDLTSREEEEEEEEEEKHPVFVFICGLN
jgi:hypothetical protein